MGHYLYGFLVEGKDLQEVSESFLHEYVDEYGDENNWFSVLGVVFANGDLIAPKKTDSVMDEIIQTPKDERWFGIKRELMKQIVGVNGIKVDTSLKYDLILDTIIAQSKQQAQELVESIGEDAFNAWKLSKVARLIEHATDAKTSAEEDIFIWKVNPYDDWFALIEDEDPQVPAIVLVDIHQ